LTRIAIRRRRGQLISNRPRQQFAYLIDRVVGNAREDMAQISLGIKAIEFGGRDQRVDRGASLTTAVGAEVKEGRFQTEAQQEGLVFRALSLAG